MKIAVTQEDIEIAKKDKKLQENRSSFCPIALAVKRIITTRDIRIGHTVLFVGNAFHSRLPEIAIQFIYDFDHNIEVTPIEFDIEYDNMHNTGTYR